MSLLSLEQVDVHHGLLPAVRGASFQLAAGEILALVGANGAGKTSLLRAIAGAHRPSAGRILFNGKDLGGVSAHERVKLGIALVPEGRRLFAGLTVEENLRVAGSSQHRGNWKIDSVLGAFPILRPLLSRRAGTLSGGEQQATAIGRALMTNPQILLLDEVSLGLAPVAVERVYASLQTVLTSGTAIVLVEQELRRALEFATRVACMLEGRIVLEGKAAEVTRDQVTQAYFGLRRAERAGSSS